MHTQKFDQSSLDPTPIDRKEVLGRLKEIFTSSGITIGPDERPITAAAVVVAEMYDLLSLGALCQSYSGKWRPADDEKLDQLKSFALEAIGRSLSEAAHAGGSDNWSCIGVTLRSSPEHPIVLIIPDRQANVKEWVI